MTNGDYIRQLSDNELLRFLLSANGCPENKRWGEERCNSFWSCEDCMKEWLESERK